MNARSLVALLTLTLATAAAPAALRAQKPVAERPQRVALVGATLLDVVHETMTQEVLILEGRHIAARRASLPDGWDGEIVDLSGTFVTPGFHDLHVHSYGNGGPAGPEIFSTEGVAERMLAAGVVSFLDLSSFEDVILLQRDRQRASSASMPGADLYSAGAAFTCPGGHGTQFPNPPHEVETPAEARAQVAELAQHRPDVVKLIYIPSNEKIPSIDRATMEAIVDEAHVHGLPVVAHVDHWGDALHVVRAGAEALTHTNPEPVPEELVREMLARGTAIIPTLAVHLDLSWFWGHPERLESPMLERTSLAELRAQYASDTALPPRLAQWRERQIAERDGLLRAVRTFSDAGVPVLTGTDAGNPGTFQGASVHRELALLVDAGLSRWQALRATTTDAGKLLGRRVGLQPGDLADLAVFARSPIADIGNTQSLVLVIQHGRVADMSGFDLPGSPPPGVEITGGTSAVSPPPAAETHGSTVLARGIVQAPTGYRLSHVDVMARPKGGQPLAQTKTDTDGAFELVLGGEPLPDGPLELVATYPGFDPVLRPLDPPRADEPLEELQVTLRVSRFQEVVDVEALSPTDESLQPQQELGFLDIVATAGTRADPLYATQALPGVVKLDEGSGLFVRGGDASEVATFLDRALLDHPYRNETPTGGFFGTVDAFSLQGLSLSSAGFPARYGNALSAVLDLTTRPAASNRQLSVGLGLAAMSASAELPVGEDASVRFAANHHDLHTMAEVNDTDLDFVRPPSGTDLSLQWRQPAGTKTSWSVNAFDQSGALGTEIENGNFIGQLDTEDQNRIVNASWQRSLGGDRDAASFVAVTLTHANHESLVSAGALDIDLEDRTERLRLDLELPRGLAGWRFGAVGERTRHRSGGFLPDVSGDFSGAQGRRLWALDARRSRAGIYAELERSLGTRVAFNVGIRADRWQLPDKSAADPRASLSVRLGERSHLRFAWGRYHQSPEVEYWTLGVPTSDAELAAAEHRVVSWQIGTPGERSHLRIEAYDKRYRRLPLRVRDPGTDASQLRLVGDGFARGADLYLGFGPGRLGTGWTKGWRGSLSYTYLDTARLYTPWQDWSRFPVQTEAFSPDFDVPHTAQLVLHKTLPLGLDGSLSARWATGRPHTPVLGARDGAFGLEPIYGPLNSERVPDFARVDLAFSRSFAVGGGSLLVYLGLDDLFDRRNVFRYVYSADWSEQRAARTAFGRSWYLGVTLSR